MLITFKKYEVYIFGIHLYIPNIKIIIYIYIIYNGKLFI